jgi:hypothetical protein
MTNKSIDPLFVSALDVLTGALGVFIILNFLNTRLAGTTPPAPPPVVAEAKRKTEKPTTSPAKREERASGQRWSSKPAPAVSKPTPTTATPQPTPQSKPAPAPTPAPVENQPPAPPQDPVAVDLMKQTKGMVTLLLQQEGKAKQSVEFMLRQGSKTWKPSRASKYQNEEFKYEKALNYFYQENIQPGTYEVLVRVKRGSRNEGTQPFALFGKIIPPGQKAQTQHFGTYAAGGNDWVSAGVFTVTANSIRFKSSLPPASAEKPADESANPQPESPKTKPKKTGKWG